MWSSGQLSEPQLAQSDAGATNATNANSGMTKRMASFRSRECARTRGNRALEDEGGKSRYARGGGTEGSGVIPEEASSRDSTREPTPAHGAATASERAATTGSGVTGVIRGTGMPQPPASNTGRKPKAPEPAAPL